LLVIVDTHLDHTFLNPLPFLFWHNGEDSGLYWITRRILYRENQ
jgi:hypothetical protein